MKTLVLAAALLLAAGGVVRAQDSVVEAGQAAFKESGCFGCHTIGKVGTPLASDLSHIGAKYPPDYMARWLRDPALQRPNAHMPALELTEAQVRTLSAYLGSLQ
jgi:mono/diheme cytochrome c family protein